VRVLALLDGSVWVNPEISVPPGDGEAVPVESVEGACPRTARLGLDCWAWETCASAACLLHYIKRPLVVDVTATCGLTGAPVSKRLGGLLGRLLQHENDHLEGINHARRVPDRDHIVPLDGFPCMSQWRCDFPSLEAASTNIGTLFVPPATFAAFAMPDASLQDRHLTDAVFPEWELYAEMEKEEDRVFKWVDGEIAKAKATATPSE